MYYQADGGSAAFTTICHCGDGPESFNMVSNQFLSNGGDLIPRISKVIANYEFWRLWGGGFLSIGGLLHAFSMSSSQRGNINS